MKRSVVEDEEEGDSGKKSRLLLEKADIWSGRVFVIPGGFYADGHSQHASRLASCMQGPTRKHSEWLCRSMFHNSHWYYKGIILRAEHIVRTLKDIFKRP
jgi:hypothetical protein